MSEVSELLSIAKNELNTEPALTRLAELRHSGEVDASSVCKIKFHGLDEESSKRFI